MITRLSVSGVASRAVLVNGLATPPPPFACLTGVVVLKPETTSIRCMTVRLAAAAAVTVTVPLPGEAPTIAVKMATLEFEESVLCSTSTSFVQDRLGENVSEIVWGKRVEALAAFVI
jgi:hypothetical protein